ncbi:hypothetical protein RCL_jg27764.t1 [Rhizophagus clarus]|uniref:Uncharacterized protein n=1 Tax=Rhizophagus clarus TaxID=94130 RepID=A0A8H3QJP3_9GLOM|nr:hypothetical protein RCL_jg27764.t1 [Rhizophagus clarus]
MITKQQKYRKSTQRSISSCPSHRRKGSQAATVQLSVMITQQNERRASILLQRGQPEIDYNGNRANIECYDDPFITLPVPPPLHIRLERLIKAVPLMIDAIRKYIATYVQESWVDVGKTLRSKNLYWIQVNLSVLFNANSWRLA